MIDHDEVETEVVRAIRARLVDAVQREGRGSSRHAARRRALVGATALVVAAVVSAVVFVATRDDDDGPVTVHAGTTVPTQPRVDPTDRQTFDIGGRVIVHLAHVPQNVGSGIGTGITVLPNSRLLAYEYAEPAYHAIALVDTSTCDAHGCREQRLGPGHSPVFAADGTLAYVAMEGGPPRPGDTALWKWQGALTVRRTDGTTAVWARGGGMQPLRWAGDRLLVAQDRADADTEGFEELRIFRSGRTETTLAQLPVAVSPDETRLLLAGPHTSDHMLELYDVGSERVVSSISIADFERALAPASDLEGADLTRWPGFEERTLWPVTCCTESPGAPLWRGDEVLIESLYITPPNTTDTPQRFEYAPTILRIDGDSIQPVRVVHTGLDNGRAARWAPDGSGDIAVMADDESNFEGPDVWRCPTDRDRPRCTQDASLAPVFRAPTVPTGPSRAVTTGASSGCVWQATVDGPGGAASSHAATLVGFKNTAPTGCRLPRILRATATTVGGETIAVAYGTYIPVGVGADDTVAAGEHLQLVLETTSACEAGLNGETKLVEAVSFVLDDGSAVSMKLSPPLNAVCSLGYSDFGRPR